MILIEKPSYRVKKVSSVLKSLTGFPIMSVSQDDYKRFTSRSKIKEDSELHLWFDDFIEMFKDENFYNIDCNLGSSPCIHLTSLEPKGVYIGCDGVPKLRVDPDIVCTSQGKTCPEVAAAQARYKKYSSCDAVEGFIKVSEKVFWPQPTCANWRTLLTRPLQSWKACRSEQSFWDVAFLTSRWTSTTTTTCVMEAGRGKTSLIIPRKATDGRTDLCGLKSPSCRKWGPWLEWSPCLARKKMRHRFCKVSGTCTLIELEIKTGLSCTDVGRPNSIKNTC